MVVVCMLVPVPGQNDHEGKVANSRSRRGDKYELVLCTGTQDFEPTTIYKLWMGRFQFAFYFLGSIFTPKDDFFSCPNPFLEVESP